MPDFRAHSQPLEGEPAEIRLSPEESHHLVAVNRCGRGDPVVVFDGRGREWVTECLDASKGATVLEPPKNKAAARFAQLLASDKRYKILEAHIKKFQHRQDALIEVLHKAQELFGYLEDDVLRYTAAQLKLPASRPADAPRQIHPAD